MCITEFDEKIYEAELRRESREEGLKEGREEGLILGTIGMGKDMDLSDADILDKISKKFKLTSENAQKYMKLYYAKEHADILS